jgi:hypothetical protein
MVILSIIASVIIPIVAPIRIFGGYYVGIIVSAFFPFLSAISSITRVMPWMIVIFIIVARTRFPHIIFSISPTVGDFHQLGESLWLLSTKFFNVLFPPNAITEGIDCSVDRNVFGSI